MTAPAICVYIAGRSEDLAACKTLQVVLAKHGIGCTSTWLNGLIPNRKMAALTCMTDIVRADAVVIANPADVHRTGTGGRHTEVGMALMSGKPVVLVGQRENVFHDLDLVRVVPSSKDGGNITDLVAAIREHVAKFGDVSLSHRDAVGPQYHALNGAVR